MKLDIEQRALKKWGTWTDLKRELEKRREIEEEVERRRKGLCYLHTCGDLPACVCIVAMANVLCLHVNRFQCYHCALEEFAETAQQERS